LAADPPIAAFDLLDDDPGHRTHVLAFDGNHRVGELLDHLALLRVGEDAFDYFDRNQGHAGLLGERDGLPSAEGSVSRRRSRCDRNAARGLSQAHSIPWFSHVPQRDIRALRELRFLRKFARGER
jgi:hypothetical protein